MSESLVADLGFGPQIWLYLSLMSTITLFFKFGRIGSVRNLDLLLLFAPAFGMMRLVGNSAARQPWEAFLWLFVACALWLTRCILDLGLSRRPLLEPNLNLAGLGCAAIGLLGLLIAEAIALPVEEGFKRNPAHPEVKPEAFVDKPAAAGTTVNGSVKAMIRQAPLPAILKRKPPQVILARVLASLAHLGLCAALLAIGTRHFERTIAGLAAVVAYLISPFTRIAVVDCGQTVPAALVVTGVLLYRRPLYAGALIGLAGGWMPACLGLVPLWFGFYTGRHRWQFLAAALAVALACAGAGHALPELAEWARALGARSLTEAGLLPSVEGTDAGSFWNGIDPAYRLPMVIVYLVLVIGFTFWPSRKNLGELITLSAALLIASQFWYLDEGGTMIVLALPLFLLMMFRPNLSTKCAPLAVQRPARRAETPSSVLPLV